MIPDGAGIPRAIVDALGAIDRSYEPLVFPRPSPGDGAGLASFTTFGQWSAYILSFEAHGAIPLTVRTRLGRAQSLYLLAWGSPDLIKVAELALLVALELGLKDRYGAAARQPSGKIQLDGLLRYAVREDGLTDAVLGARGCGPAIDQLTGERKPSLAQIRNQLAHGDPFDGLPWGGLLELVHALIAHAFREMIVEASRQ